MKKILGATLASMLVFGVAGCKKEDKGMTFAEYLEQPHELSASKLNSSVGPLDFEMDGYLTMLDIQKTKMSMSDGTNTSYYYLWSGVEGEGTEAVKYMYGAMPNPEDPTEYQLAKVDLDAMDLFIEEMKNGLLESSDMGSFITDTDESGSIEFTEIIDNLLASSEMFDSEFVNVSNVLSKIDLDINDFEDQGNGVYKLKLYSFMKDFVEELSGKELEDDEEFAAIAENVEVKFYYGDEKINEINVNIHIEDEVEDYYSTIQNTNMSFKFTYTDNEVSKTVVKIVNKNEDTFVLDNETETSYSAMELTTSDSEFSIMFESGETDTNVDKKIEFSIKTENAKTTIELKTTEQDVEGEVVSQITLGIVGNWLSDLTIINGEMTVAVESNVNVVIPEEIESLEAFDMTEIIFEMIADSMNSVQ